MSVGLNKRTLNSSFILHTNARTNEIEATVAKEILNEVISYESLLELLTRISFDSDERGALRGGSGVGKGDEEMGNRRETSEKQTICQALSTTTESLSPSF